MAEIVLEDVTKLFADGTEAVHDFNLDIPDGQFVVLVGPSGCGKTTVLRMVAGLEDLTSGNIGIGGRLMNDVPPGERDVAMVFQNYALYPHMTVFQNIALSLRIRKVNKAEMRRRVEEAARILHLEGVLHKRPRELSGGQRQRVAMGRAIVREPQAFLMDEPLSNLDAKLRVQMRGEILRIQRELGVTTIYVTHDQTEAVTLGDQVAVMRRGVLQQVAAPLSLYARPTNLFVAGFIGSPAMNLVEAGFRNDDSGAHVEFAGHRLRVPAEVMAERPALAAYDGRSLILGIRPEHMDDAALVPSARPDDRIPVAVELLDSVGSDVYLYFPIDAPPVLTEDTIELASDIDDEALADLKAAAGENRNVFVARADAETDARIGQRREIFVNTAKLHFFDAETGQSIYDGRTAAANPAMSELSA
jgi:multiple sugar transport system ATP-binding protein